MEIPEAIKAVKKTAKQLEGEIKEAAKKSVLKEFFMSFFEAIPELEQLRWTQYTPHFNDGNPCTFNIHDITYLLAGEDPEGEEWNYSLPEKYSKLQRAFEKEHQELEEVFEMAFGDGFQITVSKDGEIDVEEYYHD